MYFSLVEIIHYAFSGISENQRQSMVPACAGEIPFGDFKFIYQTDKNNAFSENQRQSMVPACAREIPFWDFKFIYQIDKNYAFSGIRENQRKSTVRPLEN